MTDVVTEIPRSRSTFIQSLRARRRSPRALTAPASWMAPPNSSSFSVSVVLPASGCAMIANVRRLAICAGSSGAITVAQSTAGSERKHLKPCPHWVSRVRIQASEVQIHASEVQIQPCELQIHACEVQIQPCDVQIQPCDVQIQPCALQTHASEVQID